MDKSADKMYLYLSDIINCLSACMESEEMLEELSTAAKNICLKNRAEECVRQALPDQTFHLSEPAQETQDNIIQNEIDTLKLYGDIDKELSRINKLITKCAEDNNNPDLSKEINILYCDIQNLITEFESVNVKKLFKTINMIFNVNQKMEQLSASAKNTENTSSIGHEIHDIDEKNQRIWKFINQYFNSLGYDIICPEIGSEYDNTYMESFSDGTIVKKIIQLGYVHNIADQSEVMIRAEVEVI